MIPGEDHDTPYAPAPIFVRLRPSPRLTAEIFRREWLAASRTRALTVLGPPMKVLMPVDRNPFPRFRPFRWLP